MVRSIQPGRLASTLTLCVCGCPNESAGPLFQFWSIQSVTKRQLTYTVFPCTVDTTVRGTVWHIADAISLETDLRHPANRLAQLNQQTTR